MTKTDELGAPPSAAGLSAQGADAPPAAIPGASHSPTPWSDGGFAESKDWTLPLRQIRGADDSFARLIIAAPGLLAACKAVRAALEKVQRYDPYVMEDEGALMDAAISKAEGS